MYQTDVLMARNIRKNLIILAVIVIFQYGLLCYQWENEKLVIKLFLWLVLSLYINRILTALELK